MKVVEGQLKRVEVDNFSPKDMLIDIHILFSDDKDHNIFRKIQIKDPERLAEQFIKEIKEALKKAAAMKDFNAIGDIVVTKLKDEEKCEEKLAHFLNGIKVKAESMLSDGSAPYIKIADRINKTGINF